MTQKTLTVNGKRFTGKQIAKLLSKDNMTNGGDYILQIEKENFFANYRQIQDPPFAPVCDPQEANAISLMRNDGSYTWDIWLEL